MDTPGDGRPIAQWIPLHPQMIITPEEWDDLRDPRPRQPPAQDDDDESDRDEDDDEDDNDIVHN